MKNGLEMVAIGDLADNAELRCGITEMECQYQKEGGSKEDVKAIHKLIAASVICSVFMITGLIGGILSNSLAILADSAHMFSDISSFVIGLIAIFLSGKPRSTTQTFGWHRAEILGTLLSVILIWVVTGILVFIAARRLIYQDFEIVSRTMLMVAGFGIVINIMMALVLHPHSHSHETSDSHGHSDDNSDSHGHPHEEKQHFDKNYGTCHQGTPAKTENINVRAAFIHVIGDLIQSLGVLAAALIIYFKPSWKIADPICTFLFSVLVMFTTFSIFLDVIKVLLERTPQHLSHSIITKRILSIPGVVSCHNLRLWSITLNKTMATCHIVVGDMAMCHQVLAMVYKVLLGEFKISETSVQIEIYADRLGVNFSDTSGM